MCDLKNVLDEIKHLLFTNAREDVFERILNILFSLSTNNEMHDLISSKKNADLRKLLCEIIIFPTLTPSNRALLLGLFVNLTANQELNVVASSILNSAVSLNYCINLCISDEYTVCSLRASQLLSNLTRIFPEQMAEKIISTNSNFLQNLIGKFQFQECKINEINQIYDRLCMVECRESQEINVDSFAIANYLGRKILLVIITIS